MKSKLKVFKFGGASIKDVEGIQRVGRILHSYKEESLVIVVSAMGKTTNALEAVVRSYFNQDGQAESLLNEIKRQHYELIQALFGEGHEIFVEVNDTFVEIDWVLEEPPQDSYDYIYDQIVSVGELVSTKIVAAYLNSQELSTQWLDARDLILTDNLHREAWVQWTETQERVRTHALSALQNTSFALTQGFIGSTSENFTTTLGREGSDYTAAILSYCLDAEYMSIWKDVPGVLTADPRLFEQVTKLDRLSYREAIEMTYYGAKVIHPKTIKPLQNKNIPLYVKSFIDPTGSGTLISDEVEDTYPPMVAVEQHQALLHISTLDFSFVAEHHLSQLFERVASFRIQVNMMQQTAISFVMCVNDIENRIDDFAESIKDTFKVKIDRDLQLVTVRHYQKEMLNGLKEGKVVLAEDRMKHTIQLAMKDVPQLQWKKES